MATKSRAEVAALLAAPFPKEDVQFKAWAVRGPKGLCVACVRDGAVEDRLDAALGIGDWTVTYRDGPGSVTCRLMVRVEGEWGGYEAGVSGQGPPAWANVQAEACSHAFRLAARKIGVGRYLDSLPSVWLEYDAARGEFTGPPVLPAAYLPPDPTALTGGQVATLKAALFDAGVREPKLFLDYYTAPSVEAFPVGKYEDALARLKQKAGQRPQQKAGAA